MTIRTEVEALFGSASRGDSDSLSDRDIIIVDNNVSILRLRKKELEEQGASVASYTWKRLERLADKGALFLQHLKQESKITIDEYGQFEHFLSRFQPKENYKKEIKQNTDFAKLAQYYPDSRLGRLWAADLLYVSLRNYGVLKLAAYKKYVFSYEEILNHLVEIDGISASQKDVLLGLRKLKAMYRAGQYSTDCKAQLLDISNNLPKQFLSKCMPISPPLLIKSIRALPCKHHTYARLRNIEKAYVSLASEMPELLLHEEFRQMKRWIENPRTYSFIASVNEKKFIKNVTKTYMKRIRSHSRQPVSLMNVSEDSFINIRNIFSKLSA